ncbi:hypothetical protein K438DRAFT_574365 [Mycena galopus ATCC 62051]|nr:hypothetical protein K438DRAFT_574365 [Mycena galopus ATCC 62051]
MFTAVYGSIRSVIRLKHGLISATWSMKKMSPHIHFGICYLSPRRESMAWRRFSANHLPTTLSLQQVGIVKRDVTDPSAYGRLLLD